MKKHSLQQNLVSSLGYTLWIFMDERVISLWPNLRIKDARIARHFNCSEEKTHTHTHYLKHLRCSTFFKETFPENDHRFALEKNLLFLFEVPSSRIFVRSCWAYCSGPSHRELRAACFTQAVGPGWGGGIGWLSVGQKDAKPSDLDHRWRWGLDLTYYRVF